MLTKPEKNNKLEHGYRKQTLYDEFLRLIRRGYRKFWYAMRDFHFLTVILITSLYIVFNVKLVFLNKSLCSLHNFDWS